MAGCDIKAIYLTLPESILFPNPNPWLQTTIESRRVWHDVAPPERRLEQLAHFRHLTIGDDRTDIGHMQCSIRSRPEARNVFGIAATILCTYSYDLWAAEEDMKIGKQALGRSMTSGLASDPFRMCHGPRFDALWEAARSSMIPCHLLRARLLLCI